MGRLQAQEIANSGVSLEQQIEWHLRSNHYPPIPSSMVAVCIEAIDCANEGNWNTEISLPEGTFYKGSNTAPVGAIIEQHHLGAWLDDEGEDF